MGVVTKKGNAFIQNEWRERYNLTESEKKLSIEKLTLHIDAFRRILSKPLGEETAKHIKDLEELRELKLEEGNNANS